MDTLVPDASVILKWVLPPDNEQHVGQALAMRSEIAWGKHRACVPALWFFEVGNALARRYPQQSGPHLRYLLDFGFETQDLAAILQPALELARRYGVTFYDACYHATAIVNDGLFVTGDQRYLDKAGAAGHICPLADWPPA